MRKLLLLTILIALNTLNAQTELISSIDQSFNGSTATWDNYQGNNYEYDANNNLTSRTNLGWSNGAWEELSKDLYTYDSNNSLVNEIHQVYALNTSMYTNDSKTTYTYNSNNNAVELLDESWNGTQWDNDTKFNINYVAGNIDNAILYSWNGTTWVNEERSLATNDSNNRIIEIVNESWGNSTWTIEDRSVIIRDANGLVLTNRLDLWNGSAFVAEERTDYTIDSNGNHLSETETTQSQTSITNYTYDNTKLMSSFAHPFADKTGHDYLSKSFPFFNKILNSVNAINSTRTIYNYANLLVLSIDTVKIADKLIIYPNPVKTDLNIKTTNRISAIEIYNVLGLRVMTEKSTKINIEHLSNGVYTLKVIDINGNKSIKKFIKK